MNKDNIFKSSGFYMGDGDILHVIVSGESEESVGLELYAASDPNNYEFSGWTNVTDYDGNVYNTVIINGQEWLVENLKVTHYADGSPIIYIGDAGTWAADTTGAYGYYDFDPLNGVDYGIWYNWYAVNNASELAYIKRDGTRETDWRVPTKTDFDSLVAFAGGLWGSGTLKETGLDHWASPNYNATNSTGFTALPAGIIGSSGTSANWLNIAYFWSATADAGVWKYMMRVDNVYTLQVTTSNQRSGLSVRLVRDL